MVILPQSYGWGRVQETGNTMWSYPAADGSVPLADEHQHEKDTGPDNVEDCSEQRQCHLNEHNGNAVSNSICRKETKTYLKCNAHQTDIWLWLARRLLEGDLAQSWPLYPTMWNSAGAEEQEAGPGLEATTRIVQSNAKILKLFLVKDQ